MPAARVQYVANPDRAISVITWMEVMAGVKPGDDSTVQDLLDTFTQFQLTAPIVRMAVDVRRSTRLKLPDAIILATARVEGRILLTCNTRDFQAASKAVIIPYQL